MNERTLAPELLEIFNTLTSEGYTVYTYTVEPDKEITSLYWYEDNRVLNVQPSSWYNPRYNRNSYNLSTSYYPSRENGSACGLYPGNGDGAHPAKLLSHRKERTWTKGKPYASMEAFLKQERGLTFHPVYPG